jgi:uncharacterized protein (TIGR02996 family)
MTDHYDALLAAALESPSDPGGWLILADWLEEQGNPAGEAVRLMCSLRKEYLLRYYRAAIADMRVVLHKDLINSRQLGRPAVQGVAEDEENRRVVIIGELGEFKPWIPVVTSDVHP